MFFLSLNERIVELRLLENYRYRIVLGANKRLLINNEKTRASI